MVALANTAVHSERYPTDLTDAQWEVIRPSVEVQAKTGPKRRVDLRAVRNGLLYKLKSGCQWELLPRSFPPKSTVHYYFQKWTEKGILVQINDVLRRRVRVEVEGREHVEATGGVIDTQSAKSSVAGGPERGFDGGKKVFGRKRHLLTDTLGLLITAVVHSARLYDGAGAKQVFAATKARGISLKKVWADQTYRGILGPWMATNGMGALELVERPVGQRGFEVQAKRWVVEIVFSQLAKTGLFAGGRGRDHVVDLDLVVGDDHPVNQQQHQLTLLLKGGLGQSLFNPLTERADRSRYARQLQLVLGFAAELLLLLRQCLVLAFQITAAPLILTQGDHACQVGLRQPIQLVLKAGAPLLDDPAPRL